MAAELRLHFSAEFFICVVIYTHKNVIIHAAAMLFLSSKFYETAYTLQCTLKTSIFFFEILFYGV